MLNEILTEIGLEKKEAQIYLTCLEYGTALASQIAKQAGIPRSSAHFILENLHQKHLINTEKQGNKILFTAEPPEKIYQILEAEKEGLQKKKSKIKEIIKYLEAEQEKETVLPHTRYFHGQEGLQKALSIFAAESEKHTLKTYGSLWYLKEHHQKIIENYLTKTSFSSAQIFVPQARIGATTFDKAPEGFHLKHIFEKEYQPKVNIQLSANTMGIFSGSAQNPISLLINDKAIVEFMKDIHEYHWNQTKDKNEIRKA